MSQGTNPTYNGEGKTILLNMIHSAPNKAELTGYKPHITGVLTSGNAADDSFLRNHLGRVYYSSLHYAGLDNLITDAVDSSFRTISMTPTGLYGGTPGGGAKSISAPGASETVLMFDFDGSNNDTSTTDRSSTEHTATFNGNAKISTAHKKFGSSSIYFDGSGDYISISSSSTFAFGTSDFTIECWVRRASTGTYPYLFDFRAGGADAIVGAIYLNHSDSYKPQYYANGAARIGSTVGLSVDTWYHLAIARSSGTTTMYVDGSSAGSFSDSLSYITAPLRIGDYSGNGFGFPGYVDDFRITKGVARYSSNFTPPTASHYS